MSRPAPRLRLVAVVLAAAVATAGCRGTMPIGELADDPGRYDGETVRVEGEVEESVGLLGKGLYRLRDATGTLSVLAGDVGVPATGARVEVEGEFRSAFTVGTESLSVLLERARDEP